MQIISRALGGFICVLVLTGWGCVSTPDAMRPPIGASTRNGEEPLEGVVAERELTVVRRMLQAGEYSLAIPRLTNITTKYPDTPAGREAVYYLGFTYYQLAGYKDARDQFTQYLAIAPAGVHAASSQEYLDTIERADGTTLWTDQALAARIAQVEADTSLELPQQLELADLYWKKGDYERAGQLYEHILGKYPQLENDTRIRTRLERVGADTFVLLTPEEVVRRGAEAEPLVIFNTSSFRSGRFESFPATSRERYYTVTGQVTNRGKEPLQDVQVIVTIYGFGSLVYDTQTINVGQLRPGDKRAFSARFNNFDNIENVNRYECVGTFRR